LPSAQLDFAKLFREQYPRIFRYVRYRVNDDLIAEDLTAEVFERAYRYRESYDPTRSTFSTWITQIAHNWINNHLVSQQRRDQHEADLSEDMELLPSSERLPEAQAIASEAVQRLLACVERLSPRDRQVVALRFGSDMRNKDIAELMGLKEHRQHSVSVILFRVLQRLRACQEES
jgi:RNA polymerase sigma-70 factor, ECF subfamily